MRYPKRKQVIDAAIRRIDEMDRIDQQNGMATPASLGLVNSAQTSLFALEAALSMFEHGNARQAIECVGDAVVMLARASKRTDVLEQN